MFHEAFLSLRLNLMDFDVIVYCLKLYVLSQKHFYFTNRNKLTRK